MELKDRLQAVVLYAIAQNTEAAWIYAWEIITAAASEDMEVALLAARRLVLNCGCWDKKANCWRWPVPTCANVFYNALHARGVSKAWPGPRSQEDIDALNMHLVSGGEPLPAPQVRDSLWGHRGEKE